MGNVFQDAQRVAVTRRNAILRTYSEIMLRFDTPNDTDAGALVDLMQQIPLDENQVRADVMALQEIRGGERVISKLQSGLTLLQNRLAGVVADIAKMPKSAAKAGKSWSEFKGVELDRVRSELFRDEIEQRISGDTFQLQNTQERVRQAKLNTPRIFGVTS